MENNTFVDGLFFERPKDGTPPFVKGRLSIKVEKLIPFLEAHKNEKGYVNVDLLESKEGKKLYFKLNTWKPKEVSLGESAKPDYPQPGVDNNPNVDDIPFN